MKKQLLVASFVFLNIVLTRAQIAVKSFPIHAGLSLATSPNNIAIAGAADGLWRSYGVKPVASAGANTDFAVNSYRLCANGLPEPAAPTIKAVIPNANGGQKVWDKRYGGSDNDYVFSILATSDGGYLLGGYSSSGQDGDKSEPSQGGTDYWVIKVDANGIKQWDKRFGGDGNDNLGELSVTADGCYLLAGTSTSGQSGDVSQPSQGNADYWLVKIDANGNKLWDKRFGGTNYDDVNTLSSTPDGGFLIGGPSYSGQGGDRSQPSQGDADYWVVKIDANGTKVWDRRFGGNDYDFLNSIISTPDGGYILAGTSASGQNGDRSQPSQ
ncbi:MAG TPA: hypothetical protein VGB67_11700, partial [Fibrella sp.]